MNTNLQVIDVLLLRLKQLFRIPGDLVVYFLA